MVRTVLSWLRGSKKKRPRSYYEIEGGKRLTVPWWKRLVVEAFGERVMSTNTATIYKFRGVFYVLK
jgi:hypothetical protein